ncbi:4-hydroxy-tetrahydrodipicolinate reductase [Tenuifilum osseticum]|uniref:4-hydroxy-tetrahydrodipicolinate reductase n=1 Tax=Tenuifilum osseticum TaxID=3374723 RepID=UPI0034E4C2DB
MLRIALIGYGKMGHEVEAIALERGHTIVLRIDKDNINDLNTENLKNSDVAIEFTSPSTAMQNIQACFDAGIPVVSGTTGWNNQLEIMVNKARNGEGTLFYASNYSIGVNIFFKLNNYIASILDRIGMYQPSITEIHHTQKLDAPSGTAITIANTLCNQMKAYEGWSLIPDSAERKIPIEAIREGQVPGTHIVTFTSEQDIITLKHEAKSRRGFALGAVLAAEFLSSRKGFYSMDDLLKLD